MYAGICLEAGGVEIECQVLRVGTLVSLPPCAQHRRCHVDTPVEFLVCRVRAAALWKLELLVLDSGCQLQGGVARLLLG